MTAKFDSGFKYNNIYFVFISLTLALSHSLCLFLRDGRDDLTDRIDFIVCLGGDGTLLYASLLFQQSVPPVMAFHLGSLGFLTPFQFDNFQEQVTNVLEGHAALTLRSRLRCIIVRKNQDICDKQQHQQRFTQKTQINNECNASNGKQQQKPSANILVSKLVGCKSIKKKTKEKNQ